MSSGPTQLDALRALDRAIQLARNQPLLELIKGWAPGLFLSWLALTLHYVERVEGIRVLRPVFALAFVLGFCGRATVLARWAGRRVDELLAPYGTRGRHGPLSMPARAALFVGAELWLWLWLLILAVHADPWLVPLALPVFALRGALAPGWLAASDASVQGGGLRALRTAIEHAEGQRGQAMLIELLLLLGSMGLAFNVAAFSVLLVGLGQDLIGLDLSFVRAFLSPRNHFALLAIFSLSLTALEPVRAALSALLFAEAELLREGVALRALVQRAAVNERRARSLAGLLLLFALALAPQAHAQDNGPSFSSQPEEAPSPSDADARPEPLEEQALLEEEIEELCDEPCQRARANDAETSARVNRILAEPEFAEFPDESWSIDELGNNGVETWIERLLRWLTGDAKEEPVASQRSDLPNLSLPGPMFFLGLAGVLLLLGVTIATLRRRPQRMSEAGAPRDLEDPFERPAEAHLDDALSLSSEDLRAAVRSIYLATLVGLERRALLSLSPERTNGQYLRMLPKGELRGAFAQITRTFDAVQYGALTPSHADFERCLWIAKQLVQGESSP